MKKIYFALFALLGIIFLLRLLDARISGQFSIGTINYVSTNNKNTFARLMAQLLNPENDNFVFNNTPYAITLYASGQGFTKFDPETGRVISSGLMVLKAGEEFDGYKVNQELKADMYNFYLARLIEQIHEPTETDLDELRRLVNQHFYRLEYNASGHSTDLNDVDGIILASYSIKIQDLRAVTLNYNDEIGFYATFDGIDDFRWWHQRDFSGWYDIDGVYQGSEYLPYNNTFGVKVTKPPRLFSKKVKNWRETSRRSFK